MGKLNKYGEKIAKVEGKHCDGKTDIIFDLRREDIKHIRRCLIFYDRSCSREYPNYSKDDKDIGARVMNKFLGFGRLKNELRTYQKKSRLNGVKIICSFEGCNETVNLTIDHKKKSSSLPREEANNKDNLQLLCPKHHLLKELKHTLFTKGLELEKIKKRISDIEENGNTDCLGYQVLSKNKFEKIDNDLWEQEINNLDSRKVSSMEEHLKPIISENSCSIQEPSEAVNSLQESNK